MSLHLLIFEYKHFIRNKAKLFSYIFFLLLCFFSISNGFELMNSQLSTLQEIKNQQINDISQVENWLNSEVNGPSDKQWVNVNHPFWAIRYTPSYVFKNPSNLLPLGTGQSEQFGFYKKVNRWSTSYDSDMAEEMSNYERLINGNIDFSFLIIFLLPILMIILTYNINGLEHDLNFSKLVSVQHNNPSFLILNRILFYFFLIIFSVNSIMLTVALINNGFSNFDSFNKLILVSNLYILAFSTIFYTINIYFKSSSSIAFKMISVWLVFCVIIPGSVHQYSSFKYPVNYMTDYLDVSRMEMYEVFKLSDIELYHILLQIHPELESTKKSLTEDLDSQTIRRSISAIIEQMNLYAINDLENQKEEKNNLIASTYYFNPISYVQNFWNFCTSTDYYAYKDFRNQIQISVSERNKLLLYEIWEDTKVTKEKYKNYLTILTQ